MNKPIKITSLFSLVLLISFIAIISGCANGAGSKDANSPNDANNTDEANNKSPTFCNSDSDCKIKDVHNCCGYYPKCVNKDYVPDIAAVEKECREKGIVSICGFAQIKSCICMEHECSAMKDDSMKDPASSQKYCTSDAECGKGFSCWYVAPHGPARGVLGSKENPGKCLDNNVINQVV